MGLTPGTVPLDAGIGDVWPTNGMHLMQLLLNNYFDELPCTGAITNGINTFTLANAANPGWYIGADITIVSGGPGGGSDLVTTVTGIAVVGANTVLTLANNAGFSLGATQAYRTSPNRELSGDWTFEGSSFPAGTDGEVGWENADTGADGFVLLESLNGTTPIYVEIAGREGQSGNFTLYWRVQNADGSAGDTSSSLFDF
jgi:hypothetical protein